MAPNLRRRSLLSTNRRPAKTSRDARRRAVLASLVGALATAPAAAQDVAPEGAGHAWEETWTIELSRGASAPLVWADSLLLVASLDRNVHLVALEPEPRVVWKDNFKGGFEAPPVVTGERIYLSETNSGRRLVALERRSREVAWASTAGDLATAPLVVGDVVYAVSSIGEIRAFDRAGAEFWLTELETRVVSSPVMLGDVLVIAASAGTLHAIDAASGRLIRSVDAEAGPIWSQPILRPGASSSVLYATLEGQIVEVDADLSIRQRRSFPSRFYAAPRATGDRLAIVGHEGTVWAYDWETAEIAWQRRLPGAFRMTPTLGPGIVVVADLEGTIYVLDHGTGELLWHATLDDAVTSEPVTRGKTIYAITERGKLYAFRPVGGSSGR